MDDWDDHWNQDIYPTEQTLLMSLLTSYYQKVVVRTYYLFEHVGVQVFEYTKHTTLSMISKLKHQDYLALINETMLIVGALNLEEENVTMHF